MPATAGAGRALTPVDLPRPCASFEVMGEAFNALNHRNVTDIQKVGYRVTSDTAHPNMATMTWQSGEKPGTKTVLVSGRSQTQYVFDPTAAFFGAKKASEPLVKTWADNVKKTGVDPDAAMSELKASLAKYNALTQ